MTALNDHEAGVHAAMVKRVVEMFAVEIGLRPDCIRDAIDRTLTRYPVGHPCLDMAHWLRSTVAGLPTEAPHLLQPPIDVKPAAIGSTRPEKPFNVTRTRHQQIMDRLDQAHGAPPINFGGDNK